jgi:ABC-type nitrate/sulfonate/bicarbonate transport system substrate-binding protein
LSAFTGDRGDPGVAGDCAQAGLFKKNNLDFELVFIQSSGAATAAMLGGDAEVGILGAVGVLRAFAGRWISSLSVRSEYSDSVSSRPETCCRRIQQRISMTRLSSNSHYFVLTLPRVSI